VLIDGDLRRPTVATRFGLVEGVGLTDVLAGRIPVEDALQMPAEHPNLRVLGAGAIPPNPSELLGSQMMRQLLQKLSADALVLIDAPPLLPVTDAALLAAQADGAVVVVRHGRTTRDQLQHSLERLEAVDAKALGVVINLAPSRKNRTGYGYGYGYGYGFESEQEVDSKRSRREATAKSRAVSKAGNKAESRPAGRRRA
jgi:receptor protein-tyrosine kinase